jgi:hypothetical protein
MQNMEGATKVGLRLVFILPPMVLSQEGYIQVKAGTEREELRAGRLMVRFTPPEVLPPNAVDETEEKSI